jgi:hypothetical protein
VNGCLYRLRTPERFSEADQTFGGFQLHPDQIWTLTDSDCADSRYLGQN